MASFLQRLIPQLTKAVVTEEVPPAQRRPGPALNGSSRSSKPAKSRAKAKPAKRASSSRSSKPAKSRAKPAKSRAKARPAKRASTSRANPAKSRAKARPAKRAASSSS